jgi:hypothetical protein
VLVALGGQRKNSIRLANRPSRGVAASQSLADLPEIAFVLLLALPSRCLGCDRERILALAS